MPDFHPSPFRDEQEYRLRIVKVEKDGTRSETILAITLDQSTRVAFYKFPGNQNSNGKDSFSVEVSEPNPGGTVNISPASFPTLKGTQITVSAEPREGFRFSHWSGFLDTSEATLVFPLTQNITLIPHFEKKTHHVNLKVMGDGKLGITESPEGSSLSITDITDSLTFSVKHGDDLTFTATPNEDHQFNGWSESVTSIENPLNVTITSDFDLNGNFSKIGNYTLAHTIQPPEAGNVSVDPEKAQYLQGDQVQLSASPKDGYKFTGWKRFRCWYRGDFDRHSFR